MPKNSVKQDGSIRQKYCQIFSKKLKYLIDSRGYTNERLASDIGVSKSTITHWTQATRFPEIDALFAVADYFDVDVSSLICENKKSEDEIDFSSIIASLSLSPAAMELIKLLPRAEEIEIERALDSIKLDMKYRERRKP